MVQRIVPRVFSVCVVVLTFLSIAGLAYSEKVLVDDVPYVVQRGHLD